MTQLISDRIVFLGQEICEEEQSKGDLIIRILIHNYLCAEGCTFEYIFQHMKHHGWLQWRNNMSITLQPTWICYIYDADEKIMETYLFQNKDDILSSIDITWSKIEKPRVEIFHNRIIGRLNGKTVLVAEMNMIGRLHTAPIHF